MPLPQRWPALAASPCLSFPCAKTEGWLTYMRTGLMAFLMLPYAARPSSSRRHLSASSVGLSFSFSAACSGEGERLRKQRRAMRAALSARQWWGRRGTDPGQGRLEENGHGICPPRAVGHPWHSPQPPNVTLPRKTEQLHPGRAQGQSAAGFEPDERAAWGHG